MSLRNTIQAKLNAGKIGLVLSMALCIFPFSSLHAQTEEAKIQASDKEAGDRFGVSVSLNGGHAIVGAKREDTGGTFAGAAYVFKLPLTPKNRLTISSNRSRDSVCLAWPVRPNSMRP